MIHDRCQSHHCLTTGSCFDFPSEKVEKNQHRNSTEYFSTKAYLRFRYQMLMSRALYATDLEGKQFFDAEVKNIG